MSFKVKIRAIRKAVKFFLAERKIKFKIDRAFRIMRAFAVGYFELVDIFCGKPTSSVNQ